MSPKGSRRHNPGKNRTTDAMSLRAGSILLSNHRSTPTSSTSSCHSDAKDNTPGISPQSPTYLQTGHIHQRTCNSINSSPHNSLPRSPIPFQERNEMAKFQPLASSPTSYEYPNKTSISARRKSFVYEITKPSSKRGFVICRLCHEYVWGPNGKAGRPS